jgi:hypothetical protein
MFHSGSALVAFLKSESSECVESCGAHRCPREAMAVFASRKRSLDTAATLSVNSYLQKRLNADGWRV